MHDGGDEHDADDHSFDARLAVTVIATDVDESLVGDCVHPLAGPGTVAGMWGDDCLSVNRPRSEDGLSDSDYYAQFYAFTLDENTDVIITFESDVDAYLYLLEGTGRDGAVRDHDDDDDDSNFDLDLETDSGL